MRWARTNAKGRFTLRVPDRFGTGVWSADYAGDATHLASGAATVHVRVR